IWNAGGAAVWLRPGRESQRVTPALIDALTELIPFAPNHSPPNNSPATLRRSRLFEIAPTGRLSLSPRTNTGSVAPRPHGHSSFDPVRPLIRYGISARVVS